MKIFLLMLVVMLSGWSMISLAGESYKLNAGDMLHISVWNEPELQKDVLVLPDGSISFPLAGVIMVEGESAFQVQEKVKAALSDVLPDPTVTVTVNAVSGYKIYIIGKVSTPGIFQLHSPTDVMQALSLAGGLNAYAKAGKISILRRMGNQQKVIKFDYKAVADGEELESNILLQSGDTIVVP